MTLPKNVRSKGILWSTFAVLSTHTANAIYPNIWVPKHIYYDLKSKNPDPKNVAILIHEQTHIKRQRKTGWLAWGLKYCLSRKFRFEEELAAIKESMKYLKKNKLDFETEKSAKHLSSFLYLWCIDFNEAKRRLDKAWKECLLSINNTIYVYVGLNRDWTFSKTLVLIGLASLPATPLIID